MADKSLSLHDPNHSLMDRRDIIDWDRYFPSWIPPVKLRRITPDRFDCQNQSVIIQPSSLQADRMRSSPWDVQGSTARHTTAS
jgi:hypothetical protein